MILIIIFIVIIIFLAVYSYLYDVAQFKNEVKRRKLYYDITGRRLKSSSFKNK